MKWEVIEDENGAITVYRDGQIQMLCNRQTWDQLNKALGTNHETVKSPQNEGGGSDG